MSESWTGGCLCGAVRFRADGAPKWIVWCHCHSCRKHSGAPASAFAAFDEAQVEVTTGEITKFASSPGMLRGFCATCGSTLTCQGGRSPNELHFHIGAFDRAEALAPTAEFFQEERLPWLHLGGGQPDAAEHAEVVREQMEIDGGRIIALKETGAIA